MLSYERLKDIDKMLCRLPKLTKRTEKAFAFPWPHEAHLHSTGQQPQATLASLSQLAHYGYETRAPPQSPEEMLAIHQSERFPRPNHV